MIAKVSMILQQPRGKKRTAIGLTHFQFEASADTNPHPSNLRNSATNGTAAFSAITFCFIHA